MPARDLYLEQILWVDGWVHFNRRVQHDLVFESS